MEPRSTGGMERSTRGYCLLDLTFLCTSFTLAQVWSLSAQSTFERRPWPWRAGAIEKTRRR